MTHVYRAPKSWMNKGVMYSDHLLTINSGMFEAVLDNTDPPIAISRVLALIAMLETGCSAKKPYSIDSHAHSYSRNEDKRSKDKTS